MRVEVRDGELCSTVVVDGEPLVSFPTGLGHEARKFAGLLCKLLTDSGKFVRPSVYVKEDVMVGTIRRVVGDRLSSTHDNLNRLRATEIELEPLQLVEALASIVAKVQVYFDERAACGYAPHTSPASYLGLDFFQTYFLRQVVFEWFTSKENADDPLKYELLELDSLLNEAIG